MAELIALPDSLPSDIFARVLEIFGGRVPNWEDVHYLLHVQGFALGRVHEHPSLKLGDPITKENIVAKLHAAFPDGEIQAELKGSSSVAFDWWAVFKLVLEFLSKIIPAK